jgi:hypothetical protein
MEVVLEPEPGSRPNADQRTKRAIDVLRLYASESDAQAPAITPSSTGVTINYARQLVREAS